MVADVRFHGVRTTPPDRLAAMATERKDYAQCTPPPSYSRRTRGLRLPRGSAGRLRRPRGRLEFFHPAVGHRPHRRRRGRCRAGWRVFLPTTPNCLRSPNLNPKLLHAVQEAADDAADDGIDIFVTTGWRSKAYQQQLLDEAVAEYGSEREARRSVGTPEQSHHVTGGRGGHRSDRRRQLAQPARNPLRAVPDLRE